MAYLELPEIYIHLSQGYGFRLMLMFDPQDSRETFSLQGIFVVPSTTMLNSISAKYIRNGMLLYSGDGIQSIDKNIILLGFHATKVISMTVMVIEPIV